MPLCSPRQAWSGLLAPGFFSLEVQGHTSLSWTDNERLSSQVRLSKFFFVRVNSAYLIPFLAVLWMLCGVVGVRMSSLAVSGPDSATVDGGAEGHSGVVR